MMTRTWIGPLAEDFKVGDRAFLIEHYHNLRQSQRYELSDVPAQTNQSFEPRLDGWCGTYNDLATFARGAVKVVRAAKNGRLMVERLSGDELSAMLEEHGYPALMPT